MWGAVLVILGVYVTGRAIPAKYLLPGVLLLVLFLIYPILLTFQLSTTNYGDGTRNSKEASIARIVGSSAVQVPDGSIYSMVVGTTGTATTGPFVMLLVDSATDQAYLGSEEDGLSELSGDAVVVEEGTVVEAAGYTILTRNEQNDLSGAGQPLDGFAVPVSDDTVIKAQGFQALEMRTPSSTTRRPTRSPTSTPARSTPRSEDRPATGRSSSTPTANACRSSRGRRTSACSTTSGSSPTRRSRGRSCRSSAGR
ncbi:hypothetical protein [Serinibacter arcticus]|uniref:hypothetical protein n=1 Tax=Serinibacter arcticus TaxID=1655435 RepID=UPI001F3A87C7|nr:hypothetical protein [Serinibacter arcticus]